MSNSLIKQKAIIYFTCCTGKHLNVSLLTCSGVVGALTVLLVVGTLYDCQLKESKAVLSGEFT